MSASNSHRHNNNFVQTPDLFDSLASNQQKQSNQKPQQSSQFKSNQYFVGLFDSTPIPSHADPTTTIIHHHDGTKFTLEQFRQQFQSRQQQQYTQPMISQQSHEITTIDQNNHDILEQSHNTNINEQHIIHDDIMNELFNSNEIECQPLQQSQIPNDIYQLPFPLDDEITQSSMTNSNSNQYTTNPYQHYSHYSNFNPLDFSQLYNLHNQNPLTTTLYNSLTSLESITTSTLSLPAQILSNEIGHEIQPWQFYIGLWLLLGAPYYTREVFYRDIFPNPLFEIFSPARLHKLGFIGILQAIWRNITPPVLHGRLS